MTHNVEGARAQLCPPHKADLGCENGLLPKRKQYPACKNSSRRCYLPFTLTCNVPTRVRRGKRSGTNRVLEKFGCVPFTCRRPEQQELSQETKNGRRKPGSNSQT